MNDQQLRDTLQAAISAHRAKDFREADRLYTSILNSNPNHPDANHNLGVLAKEIGKPDLALQLFQTALKIDSTIPQYWISLLKVLLDLKQIDKAKKTYKEILNRFPNNDLVDQQLEQLSSVINFEKDTPDPYEFKELLKLFEARKFDRLLDSVTRLLRSYPKNDRLYELCGLAYAGLRKYPSAIKNYDHAIQLEPKNANLYANLGNAQSKIGNYEDALKNYHTALKLNPKLHEVCRLIGVVYKNIGKLDDALKWLGKAIEAYPESRSAFETIVSVISAVPVSSLRHAPVFIAEKKVREIPIPIGKQHEGLLSFFEQLQKISSDHVATQSYSASQINWANSEPLNCDRHKSIFYKYNAIPEFCFGCYKVQIEPRTVLELIQISLLFSTHQGFNKYIRKSMIELRPNVGGFYKSLIYCGSYEAARELLEITDDLIEKNTGLKFYSKIKHGCSEYEKAYPSFGLIGENQKAGLKYDSSWKSFEGEYDSSDPVKVGNIPVQATDGFHLQFWLIIRNWFAYAAGLGDDSRVKMELNGPWEKLYYKKAVERKKYMSFKAK